MDDNHTVGKCFATRKMGLTQQFGNIRAIKLLLSILISLLREKEFNDHSSPAV